MEGNLDVYGQFVGTLLLNGGTVRIMEGGRIEGDVSAAHVIINGTLDGTCASSEVETLENGKMKGLFKGGSLSIRKGGQFVGQSQSQEEQKGESKGNVKQLQPEGKTRLSMLPRLWPNRPDQRGRVRPSLLARINCAVRAAYWSGCCP